jgi:hypothetical protein
MSSVMLVLGVKPVGVCARAGVARRMEGMRVVNFIFVDLNMLGDVIHKS